MKKIDDISSLNINDSVLIKTVVLVESVEMELDYIEDYENQKRAKRLLLFQGCRRVLFQLNTGFDTPNSLLEAQELESSAGRRVRIETNTTAGVIEIECDEVFLSDPSHDQQQATF